MSETKTPEGKPFPPHRTGEEAERFVAEADLSEYDFSAFQPSRFEFATKDKAVGVRLSEELLKATKAAAKARGVPYQRFIRETIERAL